MCMTECLYIIYNCLVLLYYIYLKDCAFIKDNIRSPKSSSSINVFEDAIYSHNIKINLLCRWVLNDILINNIPII